MRLQVFRCIDVNLLSCSFCCSAPWNRDRREDLRWPAAATRLEVVLHPHHHRPISAGQTDNEGDVAFKVLTWVIKQLTYIQNTMQSCFQLFLCNKLYMPVCFLKCSVHVMLFGDWCYCAGSAECTLNLGRFPCSQNQPKVTHHRRGPSVEMLRVNEKKEYRYQFPTKITAKKHSNQFLKVLQLPKFRITEKKKT